MLFHRWSNKVSKRLLSLESHGFIKMLLRNRIECVPSYITFLLSWERATGGSPWNPPVPSVLETSQMLSISGKDRALGMKSNLPKQGQILNPEATWMLHLGSHGDDSAFRDEKSSPGRRDSLFTDDWSQCVLQPNPLLASCLVTWRK